MSGPIVRSGPNEKYTSNWARAFGQKAKKRASVKAAKNKGSKKKSKSR